MQSYFGYVSADGMLLDAQAACFFGPAEGVNYAFIHIDKLASALGLESKYDPYTGAIRFRKDKRIVEIRATSDLAATTQVAADARSISGRRTESLSAVLAEFSYVPIATLVAAFGGTTACNGAENMVVVDFARTL